MENKKEEFKKNISVNAKKNTKKDKKEIDPLEAAIASIEKKLKEQGEER